MQLLDSIFLLDIPPLVPAVISEGPAETSHYAGGNVSLYCTANGIPSAQFVWYKNQQPLDLDERITTSNTNVEITPDMHIIQNTLNFVGLVLSDDADYYCEASNDEVTVRSDSAHLNVQCKHLVMYNIVSFLSSFFLSLLHSFFQTSI